MIFKVYIFDSLKMSDVRDMGVGLEDMISVWIIDLVGNVFFENIDGYI